MADKPEGTYALGVFLPLVRPYILVPGQTITAFMLEFFDAITDPELIEALGDERPKRKLGTTSIDWGAWYGVNKKDLPKIYHGQRRLPDWKANEFLRCLDQSVLEDHFARISIDALADFQQELSEVGIVVETIDELPKAVTRWLQEILRANGQKKDLLADGIVLQAQLDIFEGIPLAQGQVRGGKIHLGRSTMPWPKAPAVPEEPDETLESGYVTQLYAAFGQHLKKAVKGTCDLPGEFQMEFAEQRRYFYDAEGVRLNIREVFEHGSEEFSALKDDLYDGVCDTCRDPSHVDGLARMRATLRDASHFDINGSVLVEFPALIRAAHKKGMCHMLVNDKRLKWVNND